MTGCDIAEHAVEIASELLSEAGLRADFKTASVLDTEYISGTFDAVVCRDVLDHMRKKDAVRAVAELLHITKSSGFVPLTADGSDGECER